MSLSSFFHQPSYSLADFDRLFDEALSARTTPNNRQTQRQDVASGNVARSLRPRMDLHEDAKTNTVTATFELPGLSKENVQLDVYNGVLTVSGESTTVNDRDRDERGYAVCERHYGRFTRTVPLPQGIQHEDIKAAMDNGVLTVTFPKSTPETAPKKIAVA